MRPGELEALQPHEFYTLCEAKRLHRENQYSVLAYALEWLLVPYQWRRGCRPKMADILKPLTQPTSGMTGDELREKKAYYLNLLKESEATD